MKYNLWLFTTFLIACMLSAIGPGAASAQGNGTIVTLDGLQSRTPSTWADEQPTSRMRVRQFRLEPIGDDKDKAEVIIFFFGPGQGGSAEENVKRWKGVFKPPEGKKIDDVAKVDSMKVGKVPVTYLDVNGTYLSKFPPADPNAQVTPFPNYRMIGVVFESERGPYFIRFIGPANTVANYKKGFDDWLKGFK